MDKKKSEILKESVNLYNKKNELMEDMQFSQIQLFSQITLIDELINTLFEKKEKLVAEYNSKQEEFEKNSKDMTYEIKSNKELLQNIDTGEDKQDIAKEDAIAVVDSLLTSSENSLKLDTQSFLKLNTIISELDANLKGIDPPLQTRAGVNVNVECAGCILSCKGTCTGCKGDCTGCKNACTACTGCTGCQTGCMGTCKGDCMFGAKA